MTTTVARRAPGPPVRLGRREVDGRELMDDPACDLAALRRTYDHFALVNRLVSGWSAIYRQRIRPVLVANTRAGATTTLLDIGSGGGDVSRALAARARSDRLRLAITAIDPDGRADDYARAQPDVPGLEFRRTASRALVEAGESFDLVVSNHVLHHLGPADLEGLLHDSERLATRLVIHNDIARGRVAYGAYAVATTGTFRGSFIHPDGLMSIRRSYRADELAEAVTAAGASPAWRVQSQWPFRLLATWDAREAHRA
ncbi:methyltransferase domain-containing protein [Frondihabitans cladoniiphilus]|uniref:Class I SAM-dependent methyltransferase n=1 Tax=Frondihabitans cladoniiphilus TaxID=715785 RepID=A0ABP8W197_9MICO